MLNFEIIRAIRQSNTQIQWKKCCMVSTVFSFIFLFLLPVYPVLKFSNEVIITATGEKNERAAASEVWIDKQSSSLFLTDSKNDVSKWDIREKQLLSYKDQPAKIVSHLKFNKFSELIFSMTPYSGIVNVRIDGVDYRYDLYSPEGKQLVLRLNDFPSVQVDYKETLSKGLLYFLGAFTFFFSFLILTFRNGNNLYKINSKPNVKIKEVFFYSIPSILVYTVSVLTFWPAQMSPDSLAQWEQITQGTYSDSHPVISTLMYSGINHVLPGPQWCVLVMSLLLAITWGWALSESKNWLVNRYVVLAASVLFPIYLPTFLLISTLWKDIPFSIGILGISILTSYLIRKDFKFNKSICFGFVFFGVLVFGTRHNGIIIIIPFFLLMLFFVKEKTGKIVTLSLLLFQVFVFILAKTILISALHSSGIGGQYKAIYGLHIIGAMEKANISWSSSERDIVEKILPEKAWKEGYRCDSVVPLFWNKNISWEYLSSNSKAINKLALKSIVNHPQIFIEHQLCVTGMVWRIKQNLNEYFPISPMEITAMPVANELGLHMKPKLPFISDCIRNITESILSYYAEWIRPAGYLLAGLFFSTLIFFKFGSATILIFSPAILNAGSWLILSGSQDYRYMWPVVLVTFYLFLISTGQENQSKRTLLKSVG